jgi:acyl-[acyl-carrier-protein]-phospholipid O-acyltransferase/long-chain-fatty-acid--[acyl-carrier-protein] ligase
LAGSEVVAEASVAGISAASLILGVELSVGAASLLAIALVLAALAAVCWLAPYRVLRVVLWLALHSVYRLRVSGRERVPVRGGALLVCNHVSYLDWLLLLAAQRRFIRMVLFAGWTRQASVRHVLRWAGVLAVDDAAGARGMVRVLRQARAALARGELVCIFTESWELSGGLTLPFHRQFQRLARKCHAPIVPVSLDQIYGSLFSVERGRLSWRWPLTLSFPAYVSFGDSLPANTPAAEVRQALQLLSAHSALARADRRLPAHRRFVRVAARRPFRSCFLDSTRPERLSYSRTLAGVLCGAQFFRPLLGDAPMVGIWLPSSMGGAFVNIILAMLGKTSVNLNYTASADAIRSALRQCGARHVITSRRFTERMKLDPGPGVELIYFEDIAPRFTAWMRLSRWLMVILLPGWFLEHGVLRLGRHRLDDLATVIFSSGSTGEPKGVMLSHGNIAANVESMIQAVALGPSDRALGVLPFFHSFGYTVTLWAPLQVGASVLYHPDPRQAKEIGELCREHHCSIYVSTATFLRFCLRKCAPDDFRSVRILICGAEKLPVSLAEEFQRKFGVLPLEGYGCTELSPVASANLPDVAMDGIRVIGNKFGTVGQPLPGIVARVVHAETREPLPTGSEGLLLIHGGNVMQGYLGRPELTRDVILDGWYVTGDMAHLDADGFITLTGRLSRFAKCGGEMVPLEKIEAVLHDILGTSERICVVTCVPDESRGERLIVLYVRQDGLEVRPWCQQLSSRGLPNLWIPGERDFIAVPELPVLGSGKLNLQGVKEMAVKLTRK